MHNLRFKRRRGRGGFRAGHGQHITTDDSTKDILAQKVLNDGVDFPEDMSLAVVLIVIHILMMNPAQRLGSSGSVDSPSASLL